MDLWTKASYLVIDSKAQIHTRTLYHALTDLALTQWQRLVYTHIYII